LAPTDDIRRVCESGGLVLRQWRVTGEVLELVPASLDRLPAAAAISAIGRRLRDLGYRYVTLVVEEGA